MVAAAVLAVTAVACGDDGLSEESSCADYRSASADDQRKVVADILSAQGLPNGSIAVAGARTAYDLYCSSNPNATLRSGYEQLQRSLLG